MRTALQRFEQKITNGELVTPRDIRALRRQRQKLVGGWESLTLRAEIHDAIATATRMVRASEAIGAWLAAERPSRVARAMAAISRMAGRCAGATFRAVFGRLLVRLDRRG